TFRGRSTGDSPGAVGRALLARDRAEGLGLDVAFVVDDPSVEVPRGGRVVVRRSAAWHHAMCSAGAYVTNAAAPYWWHKPDGQVQVQTWHGTPLKRIGEDRGPGDFNTWRHRRHVARQAAAWDVMVSQSPFCSRAYRSAFGYDGRILDSGYPRNDLLRSPEADAVRSDVRRRLGVAPDQRAVLYAPTWREYLGTRDAKPLLLDAERVAAALPGTHVLVRGHYNSIGQADVFVGHPWVHDVTGYPDVADLFLAADALVTDYSSVVFDYALTDRPIVLLTPDLEQYRDVERGFYLDIEEIAPGPLVRTTDEVVDVLGAGDDRAAGRASFRERFCPWDDGGASGRVVDYLLDALA
ncbi:MAG: CDP-glycerol:glycerophosphate glycerophosphotransferase, partial [Nocardioidaceae bacterium]|nr:CDP-glycerol:glycerophosphate glycerophosphotransferase [Nocardioidaceae bacterium]